VLIAGSGTVVNMSNGGTAAMISSNFGYGISIGGSGALVSNTGTIENSVRIENSGTVFNRDNGSIVGAVLFLGQGTVCNQGSINSGTAGVYIKGGSVANYAGAGIFGARYGVQIENSSGSVNNQGTITATDVDSVGVYLGSGGQVTNDGGTITGGRVGVQAGDAFAAIDNSGSIGGAIYLGGNGSIANYGMIGDGGILIRGAGVVTNGGSILEVSIYGDGIQLASGTMTNLAGGTIAGGSYGVTFTGTGADLLTNDAAAAISGATDGVGFGNQAASLFNAGNIAGFGGSGVNLPGGGYILNDGSGTNIYGHVSGVDSGRIATLHLINDSGIFGGKYGVIGTGTVDNAATGGITGYTDGVKLGPSSTLVNAGFITGYTNAAVLGSGSRLILAPGAAFYGMNSAQGTVRGYGSTMELQASTPAATGEIAGVGKYFTGFGTIDVDPGAAWTIHDITARTAIMAGDGSLSLSGTLNAGTSFSLDSTGAGEVLTFGAASGNTLGNAIAGASFGDTVILPNVTFAAGDTAALVNGDTLTVFASGNTPVFTFTDFTPLHGSTAADFVVTAHAVQDIACFRSGTRIATPTGAVPVERLAAGDLVLTADGPRPIRWLGHRRVDCRHHPRPAEIWPVRVAAHAFAPRTPERDLFLSPDHAVFVDGMLVPVRYLVNGRTVAVAPQDDVTYWHVELDRHAVLLAEGLPCESYLDTGNRSAFANGGATAMLHPDFARQIWATAACAELVPGGPRLVPAKRRLLHRAAMLGHVLTNDPALVLLADGQTLHPEIAGPRWRVRLPAAARRLRLVSRAWIPAQTRPGEDDPSALGVAIANLTLDGTPTRLDDPRLTSGWRDPEADWRWTDGDAGLALAGAREVAFDLVMGGTYWGEQEKQGRVVLF
jgi:hypothetical protein